MRFFNGLNKLQTASLFPFILCSVFIVAAEILQLVGNSINTGNDAVFTNFSELFYMLLSYVFCYFITLNLTDGKHAFKGFWSVLCLAVFNTALYSFYSSSSVFFAGILIALFCSYCFNKFDKILSMSVTIISAIVFGILFGFLIDYWNNAVMSLAQMISGKSYFSAVLFSVFDNIFSLFGIDTLKDMIFYKSYGGSIIYGGEIVTGAKDLFAAGYKGDIISTYLSGHYFLLFSVLGISAAMLANLKGIQKYVLIIVGASAIISGNMGIVLLFFFLESPFLFIAVLFIGAIAYLTALILNLGVGYIFNGGVIEMIMNFDNPVYLLAGGVVFVAIGYFVYKFIYEKYGISDCLNLYIPTRLSSFVKGLGGIANIVRYKNDGLEVRNPKLIDTVKIDCEINENIVKTTDDRMIELKEYL